MRRYAVLPILGMLLLANVCTGSSGKQENSPIYTGISHNESWSSDSQSFVFYDTNIPPFEQGVSISAPSWLQYDVNLDELTAHTVWTLQPSLSDPELQRFDVATHPHGWQSFMYESPDSRFLVYAQAELDQWGRWSLAIADRQQSQFFTLPIRVWDPFYGPMTFKVMWSANSAAFVVYFLTDDATPVYAHIGNFKDNLADAEVNWFNVEVGNRVFYPVISDYEMVYDLSVDGSQVLLTSTEVSSDTQTAYGKPIRLMIWLPANPGVSQIIDEIDGFKLSAAVFDPDDETKLLMVNDVGLVRYDLLTQSSTILRTDISTSLVRKSLFSPDGERLAVMTDTAVYMVDTNQPPTANAGDDQTLTDTDDSGDESITLDGSGSFDPDGTIESYIWTENGVEIATGVNPQVDLAVGRHVITLTVTDDDGATSLDTVVIDVTGQSITLPEAVTAIAWNPDGTQLAVGRAIKNCDPSKPDPQLLEIVSASSLETISSLFGFNCSISSLDWSPDGTKLVASEIRRGHSFLVWNLQDAQRYPNISGGGLEITSVKWHPIGFEIATADLSDSVHLVSALNGEYLYQFHITGTVVDWSPDGTRIVSGGLNDNKLYIADTRTGEEVLTLEGHIGILTDIDWSPDGTRIASSGVVDNTIRIWDAATGENLMIVHDQIRVIDIEWNPDGTRLASVDIDGIDLWDAATGQLLATINQADVNSISWSPDGSQLAFGGMKDLLEIIEFPTAHAGDDQTTTVTNGSGNESVTLDGSLSNDPDGTIDHYVWTENGVEIATGVSPQVDLAVGTHVITLTVTDDDGATSVDTVVVRVR